MSFEVATIAPIFLALFLGGILKGATGAGVPIIAVPVMTLFMGLTAAVAVMAVVNLITNFAQGWQFRGEHDDRRFSIRFAAANGIGAIFGTIILATAPPETLMVALACAVLAYIAFRIISPDWVLGRDAGRRLAVPVGTVGGVMQGATGISAPVTITFLNALGLPRPQFIAVITASFAATGVPQVASLLALGLLDLEQIAVAVVASAVVFAGMPAGVFAARQFGQKLFGRVILGLLAVIAVRLLYGVFA